MERPEHSVVVEPDSISAVRSEMQMHDMDMQLDPNYCTLSETAEAALCPMAECGKIYTNIYELQGDLGFDHGVYWPFFGPKEHTVQTTE